MFSNANFKILVQTATCAIGGCLVLLLLALQQTVLAQGNSPSGDENSLAIIDTRIFTGTGLSEPSRVVVRDGVIVSLDNDAPIEGLPTINANGATLLPGLIDSHTHSWNTAQIDALRFGVTTMLDMFTAPDLLVQATDGRQSYGRTDRAALFSAGMLATSANGHGTQFGVKIEALERPSDASSWVKRRKAEGSDYIKLVYIPDAKNLTSIDLATAKAVINAAHAEGLLAVAHISTVSAAQQLIDAGIDGLVHVYYDASASEDLLQNAAAAGVFVIPTLAITSVVDGNQPGNSLLDDESLAAHLTGAQKATLAQSFGIAKSRGLAQISRQNVADLHAAGVTILAGSDAPNPSTAHGITLHQELEFLVQSGLTEIEALQAATSLPAQVFGLEGRGSISVGSRADLLLVDGDPTEDIRVTRNILQVLRNGYVVDRAFKENAQATTAKEVPPLLGTFDSEIDAPEGFEWTTTTDEMMGGTSTAVIERTTPGAAGSDGAMQVQAENKRGFPYPWAGAFLAAQSGSDVSSYSQIQFQVRGTPAQYRLMMFSIDAPGAPPTVEFDVTEEWQTVTLRIDDIAGFAADQFVGLAFVTPYDTGLYKFVLDEIILLP